MKLMDPEVCPACKGSTAPCDTCNSTGRLTPAQLAALRCCRCFYPVFTADSPLCLRCQKPR